MVPLHRNLCYQGDDSNISILQAWLWLVCFQVLSVWWNTCAFYWTREEVLSKGTANRMAQVSTWLVFMDSQSRRPALLLCGVCLQWGLTPLLRRLVTHIRGTAAPVGTRCPWLLSVEVGIREMRSSWCCHWGWPVWAPESGSPQGMVAAEPEPLLERKQAWILDWGRDTQGPWAWGSNIKSVVLESSDLDQKMTLHCWRGYPVPLLPAPSSLSHIDT